MIADHINKPHVLLKAAGPKYKNKIRINSHSQCYYDF